MTRTEACDERRQHQGPPVTPLIDRVAVSVKGAITRFTESLLRMMASERGWCDGDTLWWWWCVVTMVDDVRRVVAVTPYRCYGGDGVTMTMPARYGGHATGGASSVSSRQNAESRIASPNGAEMAEIIEINVHRIEFAPDDDGRKGWYGPIVVADRWKMSYDALSTMLMVLATVTVTAMATLDRSVTPTRWRRMIRRRRRIWHDNRFEVDWEWGSEWGNEEESERSERRRKEWWSQREFVTLRMSALSSDISVDWPSHDIVERNDMNAFAHDWLHFRFVESIKYISVSDVW
jgi:hypothetical protein